MASQNKYLRWTKEKIESGCEFLIKETDTNDVFIPEELNEEQRMIIQTCEDFPEMKCWYHTRPTFASLMLHK